MRSLVLLAVLVAVSGCVTQAPPPCADCAAAAPEDAPPPVDLALEGCRGARGRLAAPTMVVAHALDDAWRPVDRGGQATLRVEAATCDRVVLSDRVEGPVHIALTALLVEPPTSVPGPSWLVLDLWTDHEGLRTAARGRHFDVAALEAVEVDAGSMVSIVVRGDTFRLVGHAGPALPSSSEHRQTYREHQWATPDHGSPVARADHAKVAGHGTLEWEGSSRLRDLLGDARLWPAHWSLLSDASWRYEA